VNGGGLSELAAAGVIVDIGVMGDEAAGLVAPFAKLVTRRRPWVIAKWAMTLDGKLAARSGDSRWISGEESRAVVHQLRGRVDAIVVGRGTAAADDPLLTARPPGARTPVRIVLDSQASLALESQLVRTASEAPVLVAAAAAAPTNRGDQLRARGVEVWHSDSPDHAGRLAALFDELGRREMTNVLAEGGARVFGALFDADAVDEVHAFIAPRIVGGPAPSPVAGCGVENMAHSLRLAKCAIEPCGDDVYVHGRVERR
jgi:diaminohydroxyphosphoribosylaminopyrimidine deaminase/5-amino-6-(5-phosphoribosylamino)uracil reductase